MDNPEYCEYGWTSTYCGCAPDFNSEDFTGEFVYLKASWQHTDFLEGDKFLVKDGQFYQVRFEDAGDWWFCEQHAREMGVAEATYIIEEVPA